jgi:hypothetical protein
MTQESPFPAELAALVASCTYRPGWHLWLDDDYDRGQGCVGMTLIIACTVPDTYNLDHTITVRHFFPVPAAAYNRESWQRWLFDQLLLVEQHEAMEMFQVDGQRPYAPNHGPGWNPYLITTVASDMDRRTDFRGVVS